MKKIIFSSLAITAMVAGLVGVSYAVFSDTETIEGNTVSTANLDISVSGDPLSNLNLVPGEISSGWAVFHVTNNSTVPVGVYMHLDVDDPDQCEMLEFYQVRAGHNSNNWGDQTSLIPSNRTPIVDLDGVGNRVLVQGQGGADTLDQGEFYRVQMRSSMSSAADNSHQGQNCEFNVVFVGESL